MQGTAEAEDHNGFNLDKEETDAVDHPDRSKQYHEKKHQKTKKYIRNRTNWNGSERTPSINNAITYASYAAQTELYTRNSSAEDETRKPGESELPMNTDK